MSSRTFGPVARLRGSFTPPADKSVLHRAMLLAGMSAGLSRIVAASSGADVASTRRCLQVLGSRFDQRDGELLVKGCGWRLPSRAALDAGNSGTTMRLLCGALAGRSGSYRLTGDASLSRRPMLRVAEPLRLMGAEVVLSEQDTPPVQVGGGGLRAIRYQPPVASAQVKGCILLAGLQAEGTTVLIEPVPTRDHTERMLRWLGCRVDVRPGEVEVTGGDELFGSPGFELRVPGDLSSAAFLIVAACLVPDAELVVTRVGLNPGRTGLIDALRDMGANIHASITHADPEPMGTVEVRSGGLTGTSIEASMVPRCVDELPVLALAATQAEGETVIGGAGELRLKEADRIAALARGLRILGASVDELPDGLRIEGPTPLGGGVVDARGDHRLALTFAVAGLIGGGAVEVKDWDAAGISYPEFEGDLARAGAGGRR